MTFAQVDTSSHEFAAAQIKKAAAKIEKCINCGMPSELTVFRGQAHAYCLCVACAGRKISATEAKRMIHPRRRAISTDEAIARLQKYDDMLTPWPTDPIEALRRAGTHGSPRSTSPLPRAHDVVLGPSGPLVPPKGWRLPKVSEPEWRFDWRTRWVEFMSILREGREDLVGCWREETTGTNSLGAA